MYWLYIQICINNIHYNFLTNPFSYFFLYYGSLQYLAFFFLFLFKNKICTPRNQFVIIVKKSPMPAYVVALPLVWMTSHLPAAPLLILAPLSKPRMSKWSSLDSP